MTDDSSLRESAILKAREKYIPGSTMNISVAFQLYLANDTAPADRVLLRISSKSRPSNWVDKLGRPPCPACEKPLMLRAVTTPQGKSNKMGYQTCWECTGCGYERYSLKSISDRLREII